MRLSRIIMALTVGLAVVAVPTAAVAAQPQPTPSATATTDPPQPPPYPPAAASLTVNRPTIYLGEKVVLTGTGFGPNETVDIVVTVARWPLRPAVRLRLAAATAAPWPWPRWPTRRARP